HAPTQIRVDLGKAKPGKRFAARPISEPLKKHARGVAVLAQRLLRKAVDIDEPTAIAFEHVALEPLAVVSRRFRRRPIWIQHPQQSMDRAGIPGAPLARVPGQGTISLFE